MKSILFLFFICCSSFISWAQGDNSNYLFPEFTDSYIYYKDGRVFQVPTNYCLIKNKFIFIDKDDEKKEFSDPEMIGSNKVGDRTFRQISDEDVAEVIQAEPLILVQYLGDKRIKKDLTFGGKTETASVDSYSNMVYGTGDDEKNTVVTKIDHQFYIENKKLKSFSTEKQFLKVFPKHKEELKKYIDENKVNFNSIDQVVKLCNYAFTL